MKNSFLQVEYEEWKNATYDIMTGRRRFRTFSVYIPKKLKSTGCTYGQPAKEVF